MNLIYEKLKYLLSDSASGEKNTNTKTTPFFLSASSQLQPHSFTPNSSTSSPRALHGDGKWETAASPHQLLSATSSSSHFSLLHPGAFPGATGKHLSQRDGGAQLCPVLGQLELLELAVSGSGQPHSAATTTGEPVLGTTWQGTTLSAAYQVESHCSVHLS